MLPLSCFSTCHRIAIETVQWMSILRNTSKPCTTRCVWGGKIRGRRGGNFDSRYMYEQQLNKQNYLLCMWLAIHVSFKKCPNHVFIKPCFQVKQSAGYHVLLLPRHNAVCLPQGPGCPKLSVLSFLGAFHGRLMGESVLSGLWVTPLPM